MEVVVSSSNAASFRTPMARAASISNVESIHTVSRPKATPNGEPARVTGLLLVSAVRSSDGRE
jgi:hypothetical protein